jgi:hypothetical protein
MSERDWTNDWDNPNNPDGPNYQAPPALRPPSGPTHPDWNNGVAPAPPSPRYDWNGGSPVNEPLADGHGWVWEGPQTPLWNNEVGQWNRGVWQQRQGEGLGLQQPQIAPPQTSAPSPQTSGGGGGGGAVPPISGGGGGGVPSQLPGDVLSLFNRQPEKTPVQSAYQTALLKYMDRGQQTPSLDDPILGPQADVFRVAQQRNQERTRRVNAERAAANKQSSSGYLDNLINQGVQQQGMNTASFNANLLGQEMTKRRDELLAALQLAGSTGNQEATRELQTRLAQVQTMMQQQGLNLQDKLGSGDLALRAWLGQMGSDQFYDQLGVNTSLGMEGLNQRALQIIMGGTP